MSFSAPQRLLSRFAFALLIIGLASCQAVLGIDDVSGRQQDADPSAPDSEVPDGEVPDGEVPDGEVPDAGPRSCPAVFTEEYGGHGYFLSTTARYYDEAVAECFAMGGHLAVIEDAGENEFLWGLSTADAWIGYDDLIVEGRYEAVTGAPVDYTNWDDAQPDDYGGGEDCVAMRDNEGTWNDFACSNLHLYMCECDPAVELRQAPACMSNPAYDQILAGRRYRWSSMSASWQDAREICLADGADLVVISDADEQARIASMVTSAAWMGLWDPGEDGIGPFEWVIGDATYRNWGTGEPNNAGGQHHVVIDPAYSMRWYDRRGGDPYRVMCECDPESPSKNY